LFGCPLGLLGLTLATLHIETSTGTTHAAGGSLLVLTVTVFCLVSVAYLVKSTCRPAAARADWLHPVRCNFFAIISGTLALLGLAMLPFSHALALPVWALGAVAHLVVTLGILGRWLGPTSFDGFTLSPAQFLPAVGNVLVPLAGVPLGFVEVSWFFFSIGLILWLVLMPIIIGRLLTQPSPPDALLPTLAILIAPPSLLMMVYLRLDPDGIEALPKVLYYTSLMLFLTMFTQVPRLARIDFALSWWAYTFPMAAFTVGTLTFAEVSGIECLGFFGLGLYGALIAVVLVVSWRTVKALCAGRVFVPDT
jgi:tellurite resistance protein